MNKHKIIRILDSKFAYKKLINTFDFLLNEVVTTDSFIKAFNIDLENSTIDLDPNFHKYVFSKLEPLNGKEQILQYFIDCGSNPYDCNILEIKKLIGSVQLVCLLNFILTEYDKPIFLRDIFDSMDYENYFRIIENMQLSNIDIFYMPRYINIHQNFTIEDKANIDYFYKICEKYIKTNKLEYQYGFSNECFNILLNKIIVKKALTLTKLFKLTHYQKNKLFFKYYKAIQNGELINLSTRASEDFENFVHLKQQEIKLLKETIQRKIKPNKNYEIVFTINKEHNIKQIDLIEKSKICNIDELTLKYDLMQLEYKSNILDYIKENQILSPYENIIYSSNDCCDVLEYEYFYLTMVRYNFDYSEKDLLLFFEETTLKAAMLIDYEEYFMKKGITYEILFRECKKSFRIGNNDFITEELVVNNSFKINIERIKNND